MGFKCSAERPWGIHLVVRNDQDCPRCGWTAPGPIGDARADVAAMEEALAAAVQFGWVVRHGGHLSSNDTPFAPAYLPRFDSTRVNGAA